MSYVPLSAGASGDNVARLHDNLRQLGFQIPESELSQKAFGPATREAVQQVQKQNGLPETGSVDERTDSALATELAARAPQTAASTLEAATATGSSVVAHLASTLPTNGGNHERPAPFHVQGSLVFDYGLPAAGVEARLYNVGFAGQDQKLGDTKSDGQGHYAFSYEFPSGQLPNLQVRVVDSQNREITISATKYNAQCQEVLNLVVPGGVQAPITEFHRLAIDLEKHIGGIGNLNRAQEDASRQDLSLLNRSTGWDARLVALAATATQQTRATELEPAVLYALFRVGMPTDLEHLAMVPSDTVNQALKKASEAGIVSLADREITAATEAFDRFATKTRLALTAAGGVSSFGDLLKATVPDTTQQAEFAKLYFSQPTASANFWQQAANLKIPSKTLDALKLQGKFLYLTFNNNLLAQKLQGEIGSLDNLPHLADKDFHDSTTWKTTLQSVADSNGQSVDKLIPSAYSGQSVSDRLEAYAADLARKVRFSFPTRVVARMIETNDLPVDQSSAAKVTAFLRAASPLGYELGRTPLNAFLKAAHPGVPELDPASTQSLKTLHRLYQVTPSTESLQATLKLGFTSAQEIASYTKDEFMSQFADSFPSHNEASLVYGKAQLVSSVTFNFLTMAKQLDTAPPVYGLSTSVADRQNAKDAIVEQFPTMASLFGSLDFCECEECRSVLSPAAYFVDLLEFLRKSAANDQGYTPLDVLIGKDEAVPGRRPDLGALPLTCENTNTAMPYIDLVNEILEYYIANSQLDAGAAYDTGSATTADLTAEPEHILPQVYSTTLKQVVYPLNLPFDLWIETVRGFLNYFKTPLSQVLDDLRPADNLELFIDGNAYPYYRAQILAESLGFSPAEYGVLTVIDPVTQKPSVEKWYELYGYADENTALNGQVDPTDNSQYLIPPLKSAKNLSQRLGLTYQELTDLVTAGFFNPGLYPLLFQFQRFGISLDDAFSYTGQPGYTAMSAQAKADFEAFLQSITQRYKKLNPASTFDARTWLANLLPAGYAKQVLVLRDPDAGCNFTETTLQYADGTPAKPLDLLKLNLFVRLWKKLGWTLDETDRSLQLFYPSALPDWSDASFAAAFSASWQTALVYLGHLNDLATQLNPALGRVGLLPLWVNLPTQGDNALYDQLFLTPSVLNADPAFDDPAGQFPDAPTDPLSTHQVVIQGVLGLTSDDVATILVDAASTITTVTTVVNGQNVTVPGFSLPNLSILFRYSLLAKCLDLSVPNLIALKAQSGLNPFPSIGPNPLSTLADDVLFNQTLAFVTQVGQVRASGFTVEDLQYLLRQKVDPVGTYRSDPNALLALAQSIANGLKQIQAQNAVPADVTGLSQSLIDQKLSTLFPATVLKTLFAVLTDSQTYQASLGGVTPANQIVPTPFAQETRLSFSYDATTQTQTLTYQGVLLDWKKVALLQINNSPIFANLLAAVQQEAQAAFSHSIGDILGVWASLAEYEAVRTGIATGLPVDPLTRTDPAISLSYDQAGQIQWLAYRGVLTYANKAALAAALSAANPSPILAHLLSDLLNDAQQQTMPAYQELIGTLLATWTSLQSFEASQTGVAPNNQIDPTVFATYPEIQLSYDPTTQVQSLIYQGVLTDTNRSVLAALIPASAVLASLLQTVRDQAVQFVQTQATGLLTISAADLDGFVQPLLGSNGTTQQKQAKAELIKTFLPLQARKLSRQLIIQTLAANLGSDPALTDSLLTDAGLLSDPNHPGRSLLDSFLAIGQAGVSASYFAAADGTGPDLATGIAVTTDTLDSTNPNAGKSGTGSAHFEGYLQVPTDGPYRFFAELGNQNAKVRFQLDSPDPTALFSNPILPIVPGQAASKDHAELSQFVQLKGGVPYHFTLDFTDLGANGASLLVQGENLPKGPLSQVTLFPQTTVEDFSRARLLLSKVVQILGTFGLTEREVSYLTANAAQFNNLKLSALPTQAGDDSPARASALFSQFLTLADYADLRNGPAGSSDGLVDVFAHVGQTFVEPATSADSNKDPNAPWKQLANLTRRDSAVVRDVARSLGLIQEQIVGPNRQVTAVGDFANNKGIRRIWQALQLVQIVGIPTSSLVEATSIVSAVPPAGVPTPDDIAANLKNAVKARYSSDSWRPIAKSIFDKLRQKKRDALVALLINTLGLQSSNQLFEYFLVDPGMEPVVQTSRLRLALSSVQTFIQRCLLNLENGNAGHPQRNVSPSAIDADWWEWLKRYRVWQANREIFLFPENWLEPELRLDKSDLFQALESTLLQGDVTRELVEDAFYTYLTELDQRARLNVVSMYLDQDPTHPELSTLHVIARTYGQPYKYFYRTYANQSWSAWEVVTPTITGNQVALAIWRGKLNVFWLTFLQKSEAGQFQNSGQSDTSLGSLPLGQLAQAINSAAAQPQIQVQLHWSEYFQGKWSNDVATDMNQYEAINVANGFDPDRDIHIYVSKEVDANGNEGAVKIHLGNGYLSFYAFRVTSKNSEPTLLIEERSAPLMPYNTTGFDATFYTGSGTLQSSFETHIATNGTGAIDTEQILGTVHNYSLLTPDNPVVPPFLDPSEPRYQEAGGLVSPFFYEDTGDANTTNELTFFVQPSLTETTILKWEWWAIPPSAPDPHWSDPNWVKQIDVVAQVPTPQIGPVNPGDPVYSLFSMQSRVDWATSAATAIAYGNALIGPRGGIDPQTTAASGAITSGSGSIGGLAGSAAIGQLAAAGRLALVGAQGLRQDHLQTITQLQTTVATKDVSKTNILGG